MKTGLWEIICVGAGSCVGGICRYLLSNAIQLFRLSVFPWGTFAVNVLGCLIIGIIYGLLDKGVNMSSALKLFLTVGFCGGFTTFSTFINENYLLFSGNSGWTVPIYLALSVILGFSALYMGYYITR
ncbi:MAG: CrcB family protein [Prevotella sp.]|nr:CrcB family protein [Bacteroides sp.]MCM1365626.1 CrcB family protein [Prevotella sp.]